MRPAQRVQGKGGRACHGGGEGGDAREAAQHSGQLGAGAPVRGQVAELVHQPGHAAVLPCRAIRDTLASGGGANVSHNQQLMLPNAHLTLAANGSRR